ncbi:MAG: S8 family peptidase [Bacteroidota bacterium]
MKKYSLLLLVALSAVQAFGQASVGLSLRKASLRQERSNKSMALFIKGNPAAVRTAVESVGGRVKYELGDILACEAPENTIEALSRQIGLERIEGVDRSLQPMNDQLIINSHIQEVHLGFNLPQSYQGEGVVMGIVDEGIDYTHPDFRDEFGRTRIAFLWDQTILNADTSSQPQPYGYGKEFVGQQIDTSSEHGDSRYSHGSHVAGIACGSGNAVNNYKGVAPKSDMVVVKLDFNKTDNEFLSNFVDAVKYVFDRADQLGKPAVVNASLGTYFGSHDGKDIQALAIDYLITQRPGRTLVAAAGNAGSAPIHMSSTVTQDTSFTWLQPSNGIIYFQAWGDSGSFENIRFSVAAERVRPDFNVLERTSSRRVGDYFGTIKRDSLFSGSNRLGSVESATDYWNGTWLWECQIIADSNFNISGSDTSKYLWRIETAGQGKLDAWSFNMVFDNLPDSISYPDVIHYRRPDLTQNIVSSFTCSDKVVTVASHANRNYYTNANYAITRDTNIVPGKRSGFSSIGPTRDGRIKPDISAPGEWVLSCGTQAELNILAAVEPEKVAAGRKHKRSNGTSMSAPVVAGVAALYLERYPQATWSDVKQALLNCADRDQFTGNNLPDTYWGYGKVNGYATVKGCTVGLDEYSGFEGIDFDISPNPFSSKPSIRFDLSSIDGTTDAYVCVRDITGKTILRTKLMKRIGYDSLETDGMAAGMYLFSLELDGRTIRTVKGICR